MKKTKKASAKKSKPYKYMTFAYYPKDEKILKRIMRELRCKRSEAVRYCIEYENTH